MSLSVDVLTADNFHAALKSATDPSHRALEQLAISRALADGSISHEDYLAYLDAMHDFVGSVERWAFPLLKGTLPDIDARFKSTWLAADLEKKPDDFNDLFEGLQWSEGFAMGVSYVVEGSTLGGRYILSKLLESGRIPKHRMRFFEAYGNKSGAMWKHFLNSLSEFANTPGRRNEIMEGADFAFGAIKKHLGQISA